MAGDYAHPAARVTEIGEPGFSDDAAAWAAQRPAARARTNAEIRSSLEAIMGLARCGDRRVEALAKGGYFAATWVGGQETRAPATGMDRPRANFHEVAAEIEAAGRAAAGVQVFPRASWCDEGRIAARGVEEWLTWVYMPDYPRPPWTVPDVSPLQVVVSVIGMVGRGSPGLLGPGVSDERFPYDVADIVAAVTQP